MGVWKKVSTAERVADPIGERPAHGPAIARLVLASLLVSNAPLHVCLPLPSDAVLYDMQARAILDGGVLYRDIFETNLPGIVWIHAAVRSVVGWSSEALRMFDLAVFGGVVWLLAAILRRAGLSPAWRITVTCLLWCCYLSVSEWCHCQRDTWMLLPALAAFHLRLQQRDRLCAVEAPARALFRTAFIEGLLWAAAFWIKPFVAVPALACFTLTAWQGRSVRRAVVDGAGLLCSGIIAGVAGILWLRASGAWPFFLETFLEWNPDYVAGGRARWTFDRVYGIGYRLFPWVLLHLVAIPTAIAALRAQSVVPASPPPTAPRRAVVLSSPGEAPRLLSVLYLASLAQTLLLQQPFDYIQVPPILLAIAVLGAWTARAWRRPDVRLAAAAFVAIAAMFSPALQVDRLATWRVCLTRGSTAGVRDRLAYLRTPQFSDLKPVEQFLRSQHVRDHELTCFHVHLIHLYPQLGVRPSTRYVGLEALRRLFPGHVAEIDRAVIRSRQRFVVTDLVEAGHGGAAPSHQIDQSMPLCLPPDFPEALRNEFPWHLPVVFRSGRYLVHAAPAPAIH